MENNNVDQCAMKWLPEEQQFIRILKEGHGQHSWKQIAKKLQIKFPRKKRTGPQCRDRYINYIQFREKTGKLKGWSRKEELLIRDIYISLGPQWKKMADKFQGRSENALKNKFHSATRKFIRTLNEQLIIENQVSFLELSKILNFFPEPKSTFPQLEPMIKFKKILICSIFQLSENFSDIDSLQLAKQIHRFSQMIADLCENKGCQSKLKNKNPFFLCKPNLNTSEIKKKEKQNRQNEETTRKISINQTVHGSEIYIDKEFKTALEYKIVELFTNILEKSYYECLNFVQKTQFFLYGNIQNAYQDDQTLTFNWIQVQAVGQKEQGKQSLQNGIENS